MPRYFYLNTKPTVYYDPATKLKILGKTPEDATQFDGQISDHISRALTSGHILEAFPERQATSSPAASAQKETKAAKTLKAKLEKMTPEARLAYYKAEYDEVSKKDEEYFIAMSNEQQIAFLME